MLTLKLLPIALWLLQEGELIAFDPISMWRLMGWPARLVVILLFVMSAWSIGVMIDRFIAFSAARKQSRQFAPLVAGALKDGKIDEAISIADHNKHTADRGLSVAAMAIDLFTTKTAPSSKPTFPLNL